MAIRAEISAGKYKWTSGEELGFFDNGRTQVSNVPGHPDVVAVFTKSYLKGDWYSYLGILLGDAAGNGGEVLIIPRLKKVGTPLWYDRIGTYAIYGLSPQDFETRPPEELISEDYNGAWSYEKRTPASKTLKALEYLVKTQKPRWWNSTASLHVSNLIGFFDKHPKWKNKCWIDLNSGNIMQSVSGELVITDPFEEI